VSNAPIADFTATTRSGNAPLTVDFSDISTNSPTLRSWDLNGDGVEDSTTATPQFTYTTPGTYTVKLRATNADGFDDEVKTGWITVTDPGAPPPPPPPPPPGGAAQAFSAIADSHVRSTAPTKNYGTANPLRVRQGTGTADTYMTFLKFNVTGLTSAPASAKVRMFVTDASPDGGSLFKVANTWTEMGLTYGNAPSLGTTSLSSAGATTTGKWVEWNATSAVTGNGEVSFAVKTTSSNSSYYTSREATANRPELVVSGTSTGPPSVAPTADFTAAPRTGTGPLTVSFTDTSTGGATSWSWDFDGDGTPDSAVQNPTFTYTAPGTYDVRLTATNGGGSDQEVKLGHIVVSPAGTPSTTDTFSPIADAHVKSTSPTKNYGADTSLRLRQGTAASPDTYRSYLKFDVAGLSGAPASAKLRLFVTDASPDGGSVFAVSNAWTETALTWSNAPALGVASLSSAGATAVGTWVELDVTTAVLGNGPVSFALTTTSSNSGYFTSREGTAINRPQLVISAGSAKTATARAAARQLHLRSIVASTPTFLCPLETGAKATRA
jgi:PKD repeat protein